MARILELESGGRGAYDVTPLLEKEAGGVESGILVASTLSPHTRLVTIEYEPRLLRDFERFLDSLPGPDLLRESIFPVSVAVPVRGGGLELGSFQQVVLLDLNEAPGRRRIMVEVVALDG